MSIRLYGIHVNVYWYLRKRISVA